MAALSTVDAFKAHVAAIEAGPGYRKPIGFGLCRVVHGQLTKDKILTCVYPFINWQENFGSAAVFLEAAGLAGKSDLGSETVVTVTPGILKAALDAFAPYIAEAAGDKHKNVQVVKILSDLQAAGKADLNDYRLAFVFEDAAPQAVPVCYLKLMALSTGKAQLRGLKLDGIFGKLENVAWSGHTPYELAYLRQNEMAMKLAGTYPVIDFVDKFPRYLMHIIPADNTRVLDGSKVRFGAQLAAGTTVMPGASYINFNSGTLGPVMVEGRISSQAIVGAGSDVGGGASILGVLSGGNATPISIGEKCLLGANSVTGIPLGDGCIIDAGVTILAGTRVFMDVQALEQIAKVNPGVDIKTKAAEFHSSKALYEFKAANLSGVKGLHFRMDSTTGRMIVKRSTKEVALNADLHQTAGQTAGTGAAAQAGAPARPA